MTVHYHWDTRMTDGATTMKIYCRTAQQQWASMLTALYLQNPYMFTDHWVAGR